MIDPGIVSLTGAKGPDLVCFPSSSRVDFVHAMLYRGSLPPPPGDFRFLFEETICGRSQGKSNSSNASSRVLYSRASNEIATDQRFEPKFYRTKERNRRRSIEAYANSTGD